MIFYSIFFKMEKEDLAFEDINDESKWEKKIDELKLKSDDFNSSEQRAFFFISRAFKDTKKLTCCLIAEAPDGIGKLVEEYLEYIGIKHKNYSVDEITLDTLKGYLSTAEKNFFIKDIDEILDKYKLDGINRRLGRGIELGEALIEESAESDTIKRTGEQYLLNSDFFEEIERIFKGRSLESVYGHPVHYIFKTDDVDVRREAYKALLAALYKNKRLKNRRYFYMNIHPYASFPEAAYDKVYKASIGGTVVVRYIKDGDTEEDDHAYGEQDVIETLCEVAVKYRSEVLTVFCFPRECNKIKKMFFENLGDISFIEIGEELSYGERAKEFLRLLADEKHIETDDDLFAELDEGKGYIAPELRRIFDKWYDIKLKSCVFSQYNHIVSVKKRDIKAAPRGSAYDELENMIGLNEAKSVIQRALNYYKIQKLREERGIATDLPVMHMVFSGNPGTAKTTVARLFARIMKENGLLSRGHLVEVGRGDLVGKYVGWTAQTVQSKFKEAIGGVLFIDEAYSLVDDRSGSYGDEAINTIVQEMENHREELVVILAGYPNEMEVFLRRNPGLRSRVAFNVFFEDYNSNELSEIAALMIKKKGMHFDEEAKQKLMSLFEDARKQEGFGNGRYVRNVLENAEMNQASRLLKFDPDKISTDDITTIKAVDIDITDKQERKIKIGFY